jgi:hypothetical protein
MYARQINSYYGRSQPKLQAAVGAKSTEGTLAEVGSPSSPSFKDTPVRSHKMFPERCRAVHIAGNILYVNRMTRHMTHVRTQVARSHGFVT